MRIFRREKSLFHPKLYLFSDGDRYALFVGSSNLTYCGFYENLEANVLLEGTLSINNFGSWGASSYLEKRDHSSRDALWQSTEPSKPMLVPLIILDTFIPVAFHGTALACTTKSGANPSSSSQKYGGLRWHLCDVLTDRPLRPIASSGMRYLQFPTHLSQPDTAGLRGCASGQEI